MPVPENKFGSYITSALLLHHNYIIMARISATFKPTIERVAKGYAVFHGISFSEAVEILTSISGLEWWGKLTKKQQKEIQEKIKTSN